MRTFLLAAALSLVATAALATSNTPPAADLIAPGATNVATFNGLTMFNVAMSPANLDKFYRAAVVKHGYTPAQDVRSGATLSFYFSKSPQRGSVVFTPKGNMTSVMLTLLDR